MGKKARNYQEGKKKSKKSGNPEASRKEKMPEELWVESSEGVKMLVNGHLVHESGLFKQFRYQTSEETLVLPIREEVLIKIHSYCVGKAELANKNKTPHFINDFFTNLPFKERWDIMLASKYILYEDLHLVTLQNIETVIQKTISKEDILRLFSFSNDVYFISRMIQFHKTAQERIQDCLSHYVENAVQQLEEEKEEEDVVRLDYEMDDDERNQLKNWYLAMEYGHDLKKFKLKSQFYLDAIYIKERFVQRWSLNKLEELQQGG